MDADFELGEDGAVVNLPTGFRRGFHKQSRQTSTTSTYKPEGGRPPGYSPTKAKEEAARQDAEGDDDDPDDGDSHLSTTVKTARAKARKETALAGLNELNLKVKTGEYLPRAAYQEATATLLAMLSQGLRSLPDAIERRHALPPKVLEMIQETIDESLNHVAETLALFTESKS